MRFRQIALLTGMLLMLGGISAWMQFGVVARRAPPAAGEIDYYIEKFSSTGADAFGKKYHVIAERLDHYRLAGRARLLRPHIIQYAPSGAARHTYADTGWLSADGGAVELSGNVRVVREPDDAAAARTFIRLKGVRE
ncbi:MAG: LPS export ABC transporter periplasmic protein LptC [Gammaproteobacteria bacterium]